MKNKDVVLAFLKKEEAWGSHLYSTGKRLISYNTSIAEWYDNYHLIINDTHYSVTTSKNQAYLKREIIPDRGIVCYHVDSVDRGVKNLINIYKSHEISN